MLLPIGTLSLSIESGHQGTDADLIDTEYQHRIAFAIAPFLAGIENMDYLSSPHCASRGGMRSWPAHTPHESPRGPAVLQAKRRGEPRHRPSEIEFRSSPSQMRVAFSRIASKTGFKSPRRRTDDFENLGGGGELF